MTSTVAPGLREMPQANGRGQSHAWSTWSSWAGARRGDVARLIDPALKVVAVDPARGGLGLVTPCGGLLAPGRARRRWPASRDAAQARAGRSADLLGAHAGPRDGPRAPLPALLQSTSTGGKYDPGCARDPERVARWKGRGPGERGIPAVQDPALGGARSRAAIWWARTAPFAGSRVPLPRLTSRARYVAPSRSGSRRRAARLPVRVRSGVTDCSPGAFPRRAAALRRRVSPKDLERACTAGGRRWRRGAWTVPAALHRQAAGLRPRGSRTQVRHGGAFLAGEAGGFISRARWRASLGDRDRRACGRLGSLRPTQPAPTCARPRVLRLTCGQADQSAFLYPPGAAVMGVRSGLKAISWIKRRASSAPKHNAGCYEQELSRPLPAFGCPGGRRPHRSRCGGRVPGGGAELSGT